LVLSPETQNSSDTRSKADALRVAAEGFRTEDWITKEVPIIETARRAR
jgi:hypothetical protein